MEEKPEEAFVSRAKAGDSFKRGSKGEKLRKWRQGRALPPGKSPVTVQEVLWRRSQSEGESGTGEQDQICNDSQAVKGNREKLGGGWARSQSSPSASFIQVPHSSVYFKEIRACLETNGKTQGREIPSRRGEGCPQEAKSLGGGRPWAPLHFLLRRIPNCLIVSQ